MLYKIDLVLCVLLWLTWHVHLVIRFVSLRDRKEIVLLSVLWGCAGTVTWLCSRIPHQEFLFTELLGGTIVAALLLAAMHDCHKEWLRLYHYRVKGRLSLAS